MGDPTERPGRSDGPGAAAQLRDGFAGQRQRVLPRPLVARALARPPTTGVLVTDAGFFPRAVNHGRSRPLGAPELIVIVCTDGRGSCRIEGRLSAVGPGHALVIPAGVAHTYRADPVRPWTIWWVHLAGAQVADLAAVLTPTGGERVVELHDPYRAVSTVEDVLSLLERDDTVPSLVDAAGLGWSLLCQIVADGLAGGREDLEPVRRVQARLRRDLAKPWTVQELARSVGLSASHFSALFRRATGNGVVEYAKRLRMARARELLTTSPRPVGEIAEIVGYHDHFYFSRQFRVVHGCSPTEYRRLHGEQQTGAPGRRIDRIPMDPSSPEGTP